MRAGTLPGLLVSAWLALAPAAIPWREAMQHVGSVVTVEGDVVGAVPSAGSLVLEFDPGDATALRVVLLVPMISDLPRDPQRLYLGRRIRATGAVRRFGSRPEMILQSSGQIEVVGIAAHDATPTPERVAPPPTAASPPPPRSVVEALAPTLVVDRCRAARDRWQAAARVAEDRAGALATCLRSASYACRAASAALAPALSELEWAEQQVAETCP
jgi:hypothetical protein